MGSSRSDGNTRKIVGYIQERIDASFIDLNDYQIAYYDYDGNYPEEDNFLDLMERVVGYDQIIFATPIYWYAMSAQLKTFFDRLTDCLKIRKDIGYALKGKKMFMVSCGSDEEIPKGFEVPFKDSADYLHMKYGGGVHAWIDENENIDEYVKLLLNGFCKQVNY